MMNTDEIRDTKVEDVKKHEAQFYKADDQQTTLTNLSNLFNKKIFKHPIKLNITMPATYNDAINIFNTYYKESITNALREHNLVISRYPLNITLSCEDKSQSDLPKGTFIFMGADKGDNAVFEFMLTVKPVMPKKFIASACIELLEGYQLCNGDDRLV